MVFDPNLSKEVLSRALLELDNFTQSSEFKKLSKEQQKNTTEAKTNISGEWKKVNQDGQDHQEKS